jgi:proton-dependent oligopeptide transporter, POT family
LNRSNHDTVVAGAAISTGTSEATFMGHSQGLFYLAFTEAWERFSYYGMSALVVLYMVNLQLLPGHVEHIGGFPGFRAAVESDFWGSSRFVVNILSPLRFDRFSLLTSD